MSIILPCTENYRTQRTKLTALKYTFFLDWRKKTCIGDSFPPAARVSADFWKGRAIEVIMSFSATRRRP